MTTQNKTHHILGTSSNLFGICAVLVTGIHLADFSVSRFFDDVVLVSAFLLMMSCVLSYLSIRTLRDTDWYERLADYFFMGGLFTLFGALLLLIATVV